MSALPIHQSLLSPISSRWRALGPRRRIALGAVALIVCLAGPWAWYWWWDPWPARAILRSRGFTLLLAFSPDSRTLATSSLDGITLWDAATGQKRATWARKEARREILSRFSPDGRTFAVARIAYPLVKSVDLIDVASGRNKISLPTSVRTIYHLDFTADGQNVRAMVQERPDLKVEVVTWEAETGQILSKRSLSCPTAGTDTTASPDGRWLALVPRRGATISIWDVEADRESARLVAPTPAGRNGLNSGFSGDGRTLVVGREDEFLEVWDIPAQRLVSAFPGHSNGYKLCVVRLAPDGRTIAASGEQLALPLIDRLQTLAWKALSKRHPESHFEVVVFDTATGRRLARADLASSTLYSPDGATIATRDQDYCVWLRPIPRR